MGCKIYRTIDGATLADIDTRTRAALAEACFGVLIKIDVKVIMKKKIDRDMQCYVILGACNPGDGLGSDWHGAESGRYAAMQRDLA